MKPEHGTLPIRTESPADQRPVALHVTVEAGVDRGRTELFHAARVIVGRSDTADLRLTDPTVSLFHLELVPTTRGVAVVDLGSRNGVRAGNVTIERGVLPDACTLELGSTTIRVARGEAIKMPRSNAASFGRLLGLSPVMRELFALLERLAKTELSVLLTGATGTGKELAARALHGSGRRAAGPFVVLDCAALPRTLAPSVLFGHEKGAFTGATERRPGVFEAAHGGTVFLDEVGELPIDLQPMLLGVLERREVVPVGHTRPRAVDVRVVSATWRDLRQMVNEGAFREDLFYRLAQATARMPSLAERVEDIPLLVTSILGALPEDLGAARSIAPDAVATLASRAYPGNVRELRNVVERLAMLADGPTIDAGALAFERTLAAARDREAPAVDAVSAQPAALGPLKEARQTLVDEFERTYLRALLERTGGNLSRAATLAGVQRHNLRELLRKHGLRATRE